MDLPVDILQIIFLYDETIWPYLIKNSETFEVNAEFYCNNIKEFPDRYPVNVILFRDKYQDIINCHNKIIAKLEHYIPSTKEFTNEVISGLSIARFAIGCDNILKTSMIYPKYYHGDNPKLHDTFISLNKSGMDDAGEKWKIRPKRNRLIKWLCCMTSYRLRMSISIRHGVRICLHQS